MDKNLEGSHDNPIRLDYDEVKNDAASARATGGSAKRLFSSISTSSMSQATAISHGQKPSHQGGAHFAPFRLFTTSNDEKNVARQHCSTLREMLAIDGKDSGKLGPMRWVVIFNYLIDFDFLLDTVPELLSCERALVFYGTEMGDSSPEQWRRACTHTAPGEKEEKCSVEFVRLVPSDPPRSKLNPLPFKMPYGVHHTKMFLVGYNMNLRVIIHTANLLHSCVHLNSNGAYVQDFPLKSVFLPSSARLSSSQSIMTSAHCSSDDAYTLSSPFEENLVSYLESYHHSRKYIWPLSEGSSTSKSFQAEIPLSLPEIVRRYDYSSAYVVLIPSIPGWHKATTCQLGHLKLRSAIRNHTSSLPTLDGGPIICQFSSMGSLTQKWLHEFTSSLDIRAATSSMQTLSGSTSELLKKLKLVWPTAEEVRVAMGGYRIGDSIPGRIKNVTKDFLMPLYHRWSSLADPLQKRAAAPHIKTFLQLSADEKSVEWAVLTSHNLSRAAWGELQRGSKGETLFMRHWELGVFFSPELLSEKNVPIEENVKPPNASAKRPKCSESSRDQVHARLVPYVGEHEYGPNDIVLPFPFDTTPLPYTRDDVPWTVDGENRVPDGYGRYSC